MAGRRFDRTGGRTTRSSEDELPLLVDLLVATAEQTVGAANAECPESFAYDMALDLWAERRPATGFVAGKSLQAVRAAIARRWMGRGRPTAVGGHRPRRRAGT